MKKNVHLIIILSCLLALPLFFGLKIASTHNYSGKDLIVSIDFVETEELSQCSFVFLLYPDADLKSCEQNLLSISLQDYKHYRIALITTDTMTPKTEALTKFAAKHNKDHLLSVFCSQKEEPLLSTYKRAVTSCSNQEIIIEMNMNDWLVNNNVLSLLNQVYHSSNDVWLTFGDYIKFPSYVRGRRPTGERNSPLSWIDASFKTYYAGLFKQIHTTKKFLDSSPPFRINRDLFVLPIVKQSKKHIHFIDEILFVHKTTELNF